MIAKSELVKKAAREVRTNPKLFAAFIHYYEEELGYKPNCSGCVFSGTFARWTSQHDHLNKQKEPMKVSNTFKIDRVKFKQIGLFIPNDGRVVTDKSPDEVAVAFLMQNKGKHFNERKSYFSVLPKELREDKTDKKIKKEKPKKVKLKDASTQD